MRYVSLVVILTGMLMSSVAHARAIDYMNILNLIDEADEALLVEVLDVVEDGMSFGSDEQEVVYQKVSFKPLLDLKTMKKKDWVQKKTEGFILHDPFLADICLNGGFNYANMHYMEIKKGYRLIVFLMEHKNGTGHLHVRNPDEAAGQILIFSEHTTNVVLQKNHTDALAFLFDILTTALEEEKMHDFYFQEVRSLAGGGHFWPPNHHGEHLFRYLYELAFWRHGIYNGARTTEDGPDPKKITSFLKKLGNHKNKEIGKTAARFYASLVEKWKIVVNGY